ncbi:MAG: hypothetical protein OXE92_02655 [Bacteroidetes bacterium]|nr:hypothetical protein [Bacteroidota bacterium]
MKSCIKILFLGSTQFSHIRKFALKNLKLAFYSKKVILLFHLLHCFRSDFDLDLWFFNFLVCIPKNGQARAETQKDLEKVRLGNAELNAEMDARFAELRAENVKLNAKVDTGFAELRLEMQAGFAENKASQLHQLRWIVDAIFAVGSLIIAAGFFT